jgi:hypothetical protein
VRVRDILWRSVDCMGDVGWGETKRKTYALRNGICILVCAELVSCAGGVVGHVCVLCIWCLCVAQAGDLVGERAG